MNATTNTYNPDYSVAPGGYLEEVLQSRGMSKSEFAARCGLSLKAVSQIIHGKAAYSPETALRFQSVLGISAEVWLRLLSSYQLHESRGKEAGRLAEGEDWARKFPLRDMRKLGIVGAGRDWSGTVREILSFFNVSSPKTWERYYDAQAVAYRKSPTLEASRYSVATWLRIAEREAGDRPVRPFRSAYWSDVVPRIRSLTTGRPEAFEAPLCELCAGAGVAIVFVPELQATRISGAVKWMSPEKVMVALSLRHKSDDHFWFTLFHELGHVLLHGRKHVFIDSDSGKHADAEKEADDFARRTLVSPAAYRRFISRGAFSAGDISSFARDIDIAPGIVVGMLQHDGHIPYSWQNSLKVGYELRHDPKGRS